METVLSELEASLGVPSALVKTQEAARKCEHSIYSNIVQRDRKLKTLQVKFVLQTYFASCQGVTGPNISVK